MAESIVGGVPDGDRWELAHQWRFRYLRFETAGMDTSRTNEIGYLREV